MFSCLVTWERKGQIIRRVTKELTIVVCIFLMVTVSLLSRNILDWIIYATFASDILIDWWRQYLYYTVSQT